MGKEGDSQKRALGSGVGYRYQLIWKVDLKGIEVGGITGVRKGREYLELEEGKVSVERK